jgi:peptidoglycan/xylan/chitin deacetylase (PgdA/CDA1 family)
MSSLRILVLSNTRPSRCWRFALRLVREVPGAQICGLVQRPLSALPREQQVLARASGKVAESGAGWLARAHAWGQRCFESFANAILWCVHGCPRSLNVAPAFTVESLAKRAAESDWPFLEAQRLDDSGVAHFANCLNPDLVVALGEAPSLPQVAVPPARGWIRARSNDVVGRNACGVTSLHIKIEHLSSESGPSQDLTSLTLQRQSKDTPVGFALKADLLVDDLLAESATAIQAGPVGHAAACVTTFVHTILSPYLSQVGPPRVPAPATSRRWFRSVWSLALETILLCSPFLMARNWLRRLRGRFPVLILVHHLVSDRTHRMSISTEGFWRQMLFLHRHYRIVSLTEATELLNASDVSIPTVALTFDDGYADNFVSLRAVAEEFAAPVALFITTVPVDLHLEFQHDVIKGLRGAFPMSWEQIRYWKQRGAEIGSHTRTHLRCRLADRAQLIREIAGSKEEFRSRLGEDPRFFAFPFGTREDMPAEAIQVAEMAYPHFLSAYGGENFPDPATGNAHLLRKNAYPEPWELELELQSVFDFVEGVKRALRIGHKDLPKSFGLPSATAGPPLEAALQFDSTANQFLPDPSQVVPRVIKNS